jgi:hypothetical protein
MARSGELAVRTRVLKSSARPWGGTAAHVVFLHPDRVGDRNRPQVCTLIHHLQTASSLPLRCLRSRSYWQCYPNDWLNSFAFEPVSNLASSLRLAFASRCVLAFSYQLSVGSAFRIAWHFLVGKFGVSLDSVYSRVFGKPAVGNRPGILLTTKQMGTRRRFAPFRL